MTWLLVLIAWTACAAAVAPVVGRVMAHGGLVGHPAADRRRNSPFG